MFDFSIPDLNLTVKKKKQCLPASRNYGYSIQEDIQVVRKTRRSGRANKISCLKQGFCPRKQEPSPREQKAALGDDSLDCLFHNNRSKISILLETRPPSLFVGKGVLLEVGSACSVGALGRHLPLWPQIHTHAHTHMYTHTLSLSPHRSLVWEGGKQETWGNQNCWGDYMLLQVIRNGIRKTPLPSRRTLSMTLLHTQWHQTSDPCFPSLDVPEARSVGSMAHPNQWVGLKPYSCLPPTPHPLSRLLLRTAAIERILP